ncbi:tapasin-related protein-like isoform X2 [Cebidichthys violaceus]|uniref:tapasin-related protein-like isoform X2 n=1 Tax=Cebidichthys violaceus TaxID=271503 RepID=UPI0035CB9468
MSLILKILSYLCLCAGVRCVQVSWLPCKFTDEQVFMNDGRNETWHTHREAILQFDKAGDPPVNPHAVTFLITGSKLDLRRFLEGVEADQLDCELLRYSTEGKYTRWPFKGGHESDLWFSCILKHAKFTVTGFLRHSSDQPPPGQQDHLSWLTIRDRETLTTSVAMVIKTKTPSMRAGLGSQQKLHCQFAIDHKAPKVTVEWHQQHRGERTRLFSHNGRTGRSEGSGVRQKSLADGNASFSLPFTEITSEGTYICSVSVIPLFGSVEIRFHVEEPPRVSLNIGPTLLLQEGGEHKVSCNAERYYPRDVEIVWYVQDDAAAGRRVGTPLPKEFQNVLLSSHKHDITYSQTAFFYLKASLKDSGRQYTCSVSHQSLRMPVRKSFILMVEEPSSWMDNLFFGLLVVVLLVVLLVLLVVLLRYLHSARKQAVLKKPY